MLFNIRRSGMSNKKRNFLFSIITIVLLLLAGNFSGCETEDWQGSVDCNECFGFKPDSAKIIVYLSIRPEQDSVPLTFYRGSYMDEVDWQDTATTETFYLDAEVGTNYTVKADYRSGSTSIIAFDSDKMTLSYHGNECGYTCYIIKGGIFDVRLAGD